MIKLIWNFFKNPLVMTLIIIASSFFILWLYKGNYDFIDGAFLNSGEKLLKGAKVSIGDDGKITLAEKTVALSNIRRNYALLFFAVVAGGIAIWARFNHQEQLKRIKEQMAQTEKQLKNAEIQIKQTEKQLEHAETQEKQTEKQLEHAETQIKQTKKQLINTQKQIENSHVINRNDRFAKASDMLASDKPLTSQGGGLYMLRDLIADSPETEYIRCAEIIGYWLKQDQRDLPLRRKAVDVFMAKAIEGFSAETREAIMAKYMDDHGRRFWPEFLNINLSQTNCKKIDLRKANLMEAKFVESHMPEAKLQGAFMKLVVLEGAILDGANLEGANLNQARFPNASLKGAFISGADMSMAIGLKLGQILETTWKDENGEGEFPTLSADLKQVLIRNEGRPEVRIWQTNPPPYKG